MTNPRKSAKTPFRRGGNTHSLYAGSWLFEWLQQGFAAGGYRLTPKDFLMMIHEMNLQPTDIDGETGMWWFDVEDVEKAFKDYTGFDIVLPRSWDNFETEEQEYEEGDIQGLHFNEETGETFIDESYDPLNEPVSDGAEYDPLTEDDYGEQTTSQFPTGGARNYFRRGQLEPGAERQDGFSGPPGSTVQDSWSGPPGSSTIDVDSGSETEW
jgi:hypothetical protein